MECRMSSIETIEELFEDHDPQFQENDFIVARKTIMKDKALDSRFLFLLLWQVKKQTLVNMFS